MKSFKEYKYDYGSPESVKLMKKITPGQKEAINLAKAGTKAQIMHPITRVAKKVDKKDVRKYVDAGWLHMAQKKNRITKESLNEAMSSMDLKRAEKLMGPTKNYQQGVDRVMKGLRISKPQAEKMVKKILGVNPKTNRIESVELDEVSRAESNKVNAMLSKVLGNIKFTHFYAQKGGIFKLPPNVKHEIIIKKSDMKKATELLKKDTGQIGQMYKNGQIKLDLAMEKNVVSEDNDMVKELSMKSDKKLPNLKIPAKGKKGTSKFMRMKAVTQTKNEDKDPSEYDEEGLMMKDQLDIVMDAADEIYDIVENNENLPEWCQNKITKAADYIDSVRDYLKSQKTTNEGSGPSMADLQKRANIKKADQNKLLKIRQMLDKEKKNRPNPK